MADGVNSTSIRANNNPIANLSARRDLQANGPAAANNVVRDAFVRNDGSADMTGLANLIAELQGRVEALEARVSDIMDEETYAPVPLGQLAKGGVAALASSVPVANNAPAVNNGTIAALNEVLTDDAAPVKNAPRPAANNAKKNQPKPQANKPEANKPQAQALPAAIAHEHTHGMGAIPSNRLVVVAKGDSLWSIAERELGDAGRVKDLIAANVDRYPSLATSPDLIQPGWRLTMPTGGGDKPKPKPHPQPLPHPLPPHGGLHPQPHPLPKPRPGKPKPPCDDDLVNVKPLPRPFKPKPDVIDPEVFGPEVKPTRGRRPKPSDVAPVPVDMRNVSLKPDASFRITDQETVVTGVGTETATRWEVDPRGKAYAVDQDSRITDADTYTETRWEKKGYYDGDEALDAPGRGGKGHGEPAIPVDMSGVYIDPTRDFEIESQQTMVQAIETGTDTHWEVGKNGKAYATDQDTQVTAAETLTRTRWISKSGKPLPAVPADRPPLPVPAKKLDDAGAIKWLRGHMGDDGRISRKDIEAMPAGPGRDALLAHFDTFLFGFIDAGSQGWVDLHSGDVKRLEDGLAQGRSLNEIAGELTSWVIKDRKVKDLNKDGKRDEADVAQYAGALRVERSGDDKPAKR